MTTSTAIPRLIRSFVGGTTATTIPRPADEAAWLAARRAFWNASATAALFGEHPFVTLTDVVAAKLDPAAEPHINAAMRRGQFLEPAIALWFSELSGIALVEPDVLYVRGEVMATLDRIPVGVSDEAIEIKSTSRHVNGCERSWWWQVQSQCYAAELSKVHVVVLDAGMSLQTFVVERDDDAIERIVEAAHRVMAYVNVGQWPPSVPRSVDPIRHGDTVVELDDTAREHLAGWLAVREQLHELEALEVVHKEALTEILGEAQAATVEGVPVLTYRSHTRSNIDLGRLRREHSELATELSVEQVIRVLRPVERKGVKR